LEVTNVRISFALRHCLLVGIAAAMSIGSTASAQSDLAEKLTVHGYLSQAYGRSSDVGVYGLSTDGTTDYRKVALLLRYAAIDDGDFVLQFGHRRMGTNAAIATASDVTLDWAYWQQKLGNVSLRVGRIPMAGGIYNETRYVGTLLPFFRAPQTVYPEGFETLDGAGLSYTFARGKPFSLEWSGMYGDAEFRIETFADPAGGSAVAGARVDRIIGNQLWLNTPLSGLRLGINRKDYRGNGFISGTDEMRWSSSTQVSGELALWKSILRAELIESPSNGNVFVGQYVQATFRPTEKISISGEVAKSSYETTLPYFGRMKLPHAKEKAVGVNYAFDPRFVVKVEHRLFDGNGVDAFVMPGTKPPHTRVLLFSVNTAF
jgi:hypothetical protein